MKLHSFSFKKQSYCSNSSLQTLRAAASQEASAHGAHGRSRLSTTGCRSLQRTLPKYQEEELPEMGRLLDPDALVYMLEKAAVVFSDAAALGFSTAAEVAVARDLV